MGDFPYGVARLENGDEWLLDRKFRGLWARSTKRQALWPVEGDVRQALGYDHGKTEFFYDDDSAPEWYNISRENTGRAIIEFHTIQNINPMLFISD